MSAARPTSPRFDARHWFDASASPLAVSIGQQVGTPGFGSFLTPCDEGNSRLAGGVVSGAVGY